MLRHYYSGTKIIKYFGSSKNYESFLEVDTHIGEKAAGMGCAEVVVTDVGQAYVIAQLGIEIVELQATAYAQPTVEAFERIVSKRIVYQPSALVLHLSADTKRAIDADKRLDAGIIVDVMLILDEQRHLQVVHVVGIQATLTTFLYI